MVVDDLNVLILGAAGVRDEADPPLVVDADVPLADAVAGEGLKAIRGRGLQIDQPLRGVDHHELSQGDLLNGLGNLL